MKPTRTREFRREIKHVSDVAGGASAPLQLSLDEQLPGKVHGHDRIIPTEYGYVAWCRCGWHSAEMADKRSVMYAIRAHVGRTPQGTAMLNTLRRVGRSANGS